MRYEVSEETFKYKNFEIPLHLLYKTGGGPEDFEKVAEWHLSQVKKYIGILEHHNILEIGCGIGKDAMTLIDIIGKKGKYLGTDVIKESIQWCQENISTNYPNFQFIHHNIHDHLHNPQGDLKAEDVTIDSHINFDLIMLHSVFTHMFPDEIVHYLKQFERVLADRGKIWLSFFIITNRLHRQIMVNSHNEWSEKKKTFTFQHEYAPRCFINDKESPRSTVAYEIDWIYDAVNEAGLRVENFLEGTWSGYWKNPRNGQDAVILSKAR